MDTVEMATLDKEMAEERVRKRQTVQLHSVITKNVLCFFFFSSV